jgi:two-component system, NtrC family, sensor histidine kinase KinB
MKKSFRSKRVTMSMVLYLVIILLLSISSAYYLNRLSDKTSAILKENHFSVVYARDMSENLIKINQGIITCFLTNKNPDTLTINNGFKLFDNSLKLEKNNITETGEDLTASNIETNYNDYRDSVVKFIKSPNSIADVLNLQKKFDILYQQLMSLSQLNEKAIEEKTEDAKVSAKSATLQMTFIGTLCILIAYGYIFIFSAYFNERFYKMYNGIKEIVSSNYRQRLYLRGNDELSEISLLVNKMADKIHKVDDDSFVSIEEPLMRKADPGELKELKSVLEKMKIFAKQASDLLSKLENKEL